MARNIPIAVAKGDGIGPEIMDATLRILKAANAPLDYHFIEIGKDVYLRGVSAGIEPGAWETLRRTKVFLKAPITTPQGGGYKSLNVTTRKTLGLYANVRSCQSYAPFVYTKHANMDTVIIRENEEDLYAGIEHQQTNEVTQCLKLISKPGCEKIIRYAFEYAQHYNRKKVTAFSKDNIMKLTDGLFHKMFNEIAKEYPDIESDHMIIDIASAKLAEHPEQFDVVVTLNLYGDIVSDIAAEVAGSVGLAGSANIGQGYAMFEAIHGSAPDIAGQGIANPSGLLHGAIQMLVHLGLTEEAEMVHNAWLKTLEDGIHTRDIYNAPQSRVLAGTDDFAAAVIERLGKYPEILQKVSYEAHGPMPEPTVHPTPKQKKETIGVDIFLDWSDGSADDLGNALNKITAGNLSLEMITNRGVVVYPGGMPETFCSDHWRCRYLTPDQQPIAYADVLDLLQQLNDKGYDVIKTENLCTFDGQIGFSLAQGQ